jgi:hypothetical protein
MSAAKAEPAIASATAAKTNFFIMFPIHSKVSPDSVSDGKAGAEFAGSRANLLWAADAMKQKVPSSAYFLSIIVMVLNVNQRLL